MLEKHLTALLLSLIPATRAMPEGSCPSLGLASGMDCPTCLSNPNGTAEAVIPSSNGTSLVIGHNGNQPHFCPFRIIRRYGLCPG